MPLTDYLLYCISKKWPSPTAQRDNRIGGEPGSEEYEQGYALEQFNQCVRNGLGNAVMGKDVLEIGCGHGGISVYMAAVGARSVVGIDVSDRVLRVANQLAVQHAANFGPNARIPVRFLEMSAYDLQFSPESFDLVIAANAFEHFAEPESVMRCAHRVLRPGGGILVPNFPSIYSKHGLHLKHGLKLPWANLIFSERTIVRALQRAAADRPELHKIYPGLKNNPQSVREVRKYSDLNGITHRKFKTWAANAGFRVERFRVAATRLGKVLSMLPGFNQTILEDIFSTGASAYLTKVAVPANKVTTINGISHR